MVFKKNRNIDAVLFSLILSLFSCKTNKYGMELENKRPAGDVTIGSDSKGKKLAYTGILPIGKSSIEAVIRSGYYVDKTYHAEKLFKEEATVFLSRPRRFGKSLFVSTLEEIAKGNKELFQDCHIYNKTNYDWKKYPVIRVDFGGKGNITPDNLILYLEDKLKDVASDYKLTVTGDTFQSRLENLVKKMTDLNGYANKIVVLVDEYDVPFINQPDPVIKESNRLIVRDFLTEIKTLADNNKIKLEFVTGVSAYCFKECNSGPNNLDDITLDLGYDTIAGYREEDLLQKGSAYIKRIDELAKRKKVSRDVFVSKMRSKYNGYKFAVEEDNIEEDNAEKNTIPVSVYNPWSTLKFLKDGRLNNYWYNSGTPTFLTKNIDNSYFDIDLSKNIVTTEAKLISPKEGQLDMIGKMFQSGYLTIDKYKELSDEEKKVWAKGWNSDTRPLLVKFPNDEVEDSFYDSLFEELKESLQSKAKNSEDNIRNYLINVDINGFMSTIESSFSSIPYFLFLQEQNKNEAFYHSVLHSFLRGARLNPESEKCSNIGRIDIVINSIPNITYLFELKHGKDAHTAIEQVEHTKYIQQYIRQNKDIVVIGINFDSDKRNFNDYKCRYYDSKGNEIPDRNAFLDHINSKKIGGRKVTRQRG